MMSKAHYKFKNAMHLNATELTCSTGVSAFQIFKIVFCVHYKLCLHAEIFKLLSN